MGACLAVAGPGDVPGAKRNLQGCAGVDVRRER